MIAKLARYFQLDTQPLLSVPFVLPVPKAFLWWYHAPAQIDCDHCRYNCTRILLYDQRAEGAGVAAALYSFIAELLQYDLLEYCTSCYSSTKGCDGGCPACLQSVPCDNFHQDLTLSAGIRVGKHLINRFDMSNFNSRKKGSDSEKLLNRRRQKAYTHPKQIAEC